MMMVKFPTLFIASCAVILSSFTPTSYAAPLSNVQRDSKIVFSPHITSPTSSAVWTMGSTQKVTWETANLPNEKRKSYGLVLLGYLENGNEHLDVHNPLAAGFYMDAGSVTIKVPKNLKERNDYICVVFGDSGNISQRFKITNVRK